MRAGGLLLPGTMLLNGTMLKAANSAGRQADGVRSANRLCLSLVSSRRHAPSHAACSVPRTACMQVVYTSPSPRYAGLKFYATPMKVGTFVWLPTYTMSPVAFCPSAPTGICGWYVCVQVPRVRRHALGLRDADVQAEARPNEDPSRNHGFHRNARRRT